MDLQGGPIRADSRGVSNFLHTIGVCVFAVLVLAPTAVCQGIQLEEKPARWRFSIEALDVQGVGDGSLAGVHYELLDLFDLPGLYGGVGAYGALTGDLGGFFAGGLNVGWRRPLIEHFSVEIGAFAGAGGGGAAAEGTSGLVLRPFLALDHQFERYAVRVEVSNTRLADSDFDEFSISLGLTVPVRFLTGRVRSGWTAPISIDALEFERWELESGLLELSPTSGSSRQDGTPYTEDILMGGVRLNATLDDHSHLPIEAWGALEGDVAGFRALMAGYGRHGPILDSVLPGVLTWELEVLGGLAGGGNTDTGGGLVLEASAGLRARLARNWTGHVAMSYLDAPTGDLTATGLQIGLAWDPRMLRLAPGYDRERLATEALPPSEGTFDVWQLGTGWKVYLPRGSAQKKSGENLEPVLHLAGVSAERHINEHVSAVVRAFGAVGGNIGGYSEGLVGLRAAFQPFDFLRSADLYVEYDLGAAGGGDLDVGSGLVHQLSAGVAWQPIPGVEMGVGLGRFNARTSGGFSADVLEAGITFDVARLIARH